MFFLQVCSTTGAATGEGGRAGTGRPASQPAGPVAGMTSKNIKLACINHRYNDIRLKIYILEYSIAFHEIKLSIFNKFYGMLL